MFKAQLVSVHVLILGVQDMRKLLQKPVQHMKTFLIVSRAQCIVMLNIIHADIFNITCSLTSTVKGRPIISHSRNRQFRKPIWTVSVSPVAIYKMFASFLLKLKLFLIKFILFCTIFCWSSQMPNKLRPECPMFLSGIFRRKMESVKT